MILQFLPVRDLNARLASIAQGEFVLKRTELTRMLFTPSGRFHVLINVIVKFSRIANLISVLIRLSGDTLHEEIADRAVTSTKFGTFVRWLFSPGSQHVC